MDIGVLNFVTDYSMRPAELAVALEERGFESLWVPEHTHIPASRRSPWPGGPDLPREYWHAMDPFVALGAAAAVTTNLKIGTGICLIVERDPIITAKEIATLDMISNGRFLFGIGGGWNSEEMENHGTNFRRRFRLLRERILAMKAIWTEEEAEFHGEFVDFDKIWSYPKPVQKPHPPIFMGGDGQPPLTGWWSSATAGCPLPAAAGQEGVLTEKIALLRKQAEEAGRDPSGIPVSLCVFAPPDESLVARMEEAGVDRLIFNLPSDERDKVLPVLDEYAALIP